MIRAIVLLLLLPVLALAQEPIAPSLSIKGDGVKVVKIDRVVIVKEDATVVQSFPFTVNAPAGKGLYFWTAPGMTFEDRNDSIVVTGAAKGQANVSVKAVGVKLDKDGKFIDFETRTYSISFVVGDIPTPTPVPPVPVPPTPEPTPSPAPIPLAGFRVLMVYEESAADKAALLKSSPDQYWALFGGEYRDWLIANTVKGTDGKTPELRIFDKDANVSNAEKHWRDAFERTKGKGVPYMVISNHPKGGWEGLMPKTNSEIKAKLEAYK